MAPLAKNGGPQKKSWIAVAFAALCVAGFLAAAAFGDTGDAGTSSSGSTDTTATVSSSSSTDTAPTSTTPVDTTSTATSTTADTTTTSTSADTTTSTPSATTTTTPALAPTISTDKTAYQPGDTVAVTGANWAPGASVHLHVVDNGASGWIYDKDLLAAANGAIDDSFALPLAFASTFTATATAGTATATTNFSDAFSGLPVPYIVAFASGTSASAQASEIAAAGGTDTGSIAPLSMHSITFPSGGAQAGVTALQANSNVVRVEQDHSRDTAGTPDDPQYPQQWSLPRIGWDQVYGSVNPGGSATVAVLDTGVDASHADLAGKVVGGTNAITGSGDGESDPNGHGTAMAGIVAAATNNGAGIAGIGYAGVQIMPVTVLNDQGLGYDSDVISGVVYAVQHHADVILMAFSNPGYSASLQQAIDWAWSDGAVLVAATGNDGSSTVNYPAGDRGVIGVGNTDGNDNLNPSSNTGADVFLAAPGTDILSTAAGGGYSSNTGTSAAAAAVAGAAALIKAASVGASNGVIVNRLAANADAAGSSAQTGNGRLNLDRAINDTSSTSVEPAGAAPIGNGGPYVGPYTAAAAAITLSPNAGGPGDLVTVSGSGFAKSTSVTIKWDGSGGTTVTSCSTTGNGSINAACQFAVPTGAALGSHTVFATDNNNSATTTFTVKRPTSTSVSCATPVLVGQPSSCTITVTDNLSGAVTPTGTVSLTAIGASVSPTSTSCTLSGNGNSASCSASFTGGAGGTISVSATYSGDANHVGSSGSGSITVNTQAATSLAVSSATGTYGGTVNLTATLTSGGSGVSGKTISFTLNGSSAGSASTNASGVATVTGVSLSGINAGTYNPGANSGVAASFAGDTNFTASNGSNTLTVNKAPLTVTANNQSRAYGDANPSLTFQTTGFVNGETSAVLTTQPACTTTATASSSVAGSPYPITCSGGAAANYSFSYVNGQLTVTPALLTVTANNQSRGYGDANPTLTFQITGFKNSENSSVLTAQPTCSTTATASSSVSGSPYPISCSGGASANYSFSYVNGQLTVTRAPLTVTANNQSRAYGDANPSLTFQISGFKNGETSSVLTTQPTCSTTATASSSVSGSPYAITCSGGAAANYSFSYVNGQLTVTPALLTVTANNQSRGYGDANPTLTFQITGFKNSENSSVLTAQPTCLTTATASSSVSGSPYPITCSGGASANYSFSYVNGQLTVTKAALTVTADNQSRGYGNANPSLTFQIAGFKNGETSSVLTTQPTCTTTATASSSVAGGPYAITCSGGAAVNYSFSYVNGQLTVTPALLTVSADNQSRAYGDANPNLTFQISGFKNGETSSVLSTQPTCSTAAVATSSVAGSPYTISCSGAAAANYSFSYVNGNLSVTRAPLTVTADNQSRTYGDANPTLTFQVTGFKNGESSSVLTTQPTCTTAATAASSVAGGPYPISCSGAAASNYSFSYANGQLTVTPALLTVSADNQSRAYGDANPSLTFQISGFKNGQTSSVLTTQPTCSTAATAASSVAGSPYTISCSGGAAANYSFSYVNGQLTVTRAPLTVTAGNQSREYGDGNPALSFQISGFQNGESSSVLTTQPTCATTATAASSVAGSPYAISCSGAAAANYSFSYVNGQLTVTPALLTVTANNQSREYGDANPTLTFQISGFKNGQTSAVLSTQPTCATAATAASSVAGSPYTISCSGGAAANYSFSYANGQLTVTRAPLTVTADNQSREYGDANPALSFQISGFKNGESSSVLTTQPSCSTPAVATSSVAGSPYTISCSGAAAANYSFSYANGQLTVTRAPLTVTADDRSREYGDANPTLSFQISGFKNAETSSVLSTQPSCSTAATAASSVAGSPYTISCSGAAAANYSFSYANGQLTVTRAPLTVTAGNQSREYGDGNPALSFQISGFKNGETSSALTTQPTCSTPATATSSVGGSPYAITCSGAAAANYSFGYVAGKLTITPALLTVTADNQSREYGDANPALSFQISGFKNSETASVLSTQPSCSTAATAASSVAGSPYAISCSGGAAANYSFSYVNGQLTVTRAPLTVNADNQSRTYGDANPALSFQITGFKNGETSASLTAQPTCSTSAVATSSVAGSPYAIYCSAAAAANYSFTYVNGNLTVTPALLTVTANNQSRAYGDANPALSFQISGFKNSETSSVLSTQPTCTTPAAATSSVAGSPYAISCSGGAAANYSFSYVNGNLTVTRAPLTVNADNQSRTYGDANPSLTFQITGFKNGETAAVLTAQPTCSTAATPASSVAGSPYAIYCSGAGAANYSFTYVKGNLTVTPALLTVTANNQSRAYGDANPTLSFQISGFKNSETASVLSTQPTCSTPAVATSSVAGSPYTISCSGAAAANYSFSYVNGNLTVTRAPLIVTADHKSRTYGYANPSLTFQITGFQNGETAAVLTAQPTCSTAATPTSSVAGSPYAISCSGAAAANYSFSYVNGQLTVTPALLTVTADNQSRAYGDANPTLSLQITGFKNSETAAVLTTQPSCSTPAVATSSVGGSPYTISCSGAAAANYSFSYVNGTLTVTRAPLTVTADNKSRTYGYANPALTSQITGFKNGETSSVLTTQPTCTTTAVATSPVSGSPYPIACSGAAAANYSFSYVAGQLTVTPALLTVTANNQSRGYGDANPSLTFQITGFKNGETSSVLSAQPTCSTPAVATSSVAGSPYTISCSGAAAANYSFSYVNGTLTVTRALLTVSGDNKSRTYGDANPSLTFQITGFKNGESASALTTQPTCSTAAVATSPISGSPYTISCSGAAAANYSFSYVNAQLTVTPALLTVAADNKSRVYGDANPSLTFQISGFKNGENSSALTTQPTCTTPAIATSSIASSPFTISCSGAAAANYSFSYVNGALTVTKALLTVSGDNKSAQYTDASPALTFQFSGFKNGENSSVLTTQPTCTTTRTSTSPAGTYPITCSGGAAANYSFSYVNGTFTVTQEDAAVQYSGDTIGQTGANLTLQANVWDSAASGFPGTSGSGPDSTIGDITKIWVEFDIYNGGTCGSGTPIATPRAQVVDTGTVGDGLGTATTTYTSSSENTYCVLPKVVATSAGGTNLYYTAPNAMNAVINFYNNTGQFVTGGGWITDPNVGGHGNFGFNARYNKNNQPQGQFVYVWRATYQGVAADYIIKSNSLTALGFTQTTTSSNGYPMTSTLQGKCNLQINRASDGVALASEGNDTFIATATDSGLPSSNAGDALTLTLSGSSLATKSFSNVPLNGGNEVIHMK